MVSKVIVAALVIIVACPIMLGYGMNLTETTTYEYKSNNDPVNVTLLLQNNSDHYVLSGDILSINTGWVAGTSGNVRIFPDFKKIGGMNTSLPISEYHSNNTNWKPDDTYIHHYTYYDIYAQYNDNNCTLNVTINYNDGTPAATINKLNALSWEGVTGTLTYSVYGSGTKYTDTNTEFIEYLHFYTTGTYLANTQTHYNNVYWTTNYADLAAGYQVGKNSGLNSSLKLPNYKSLLLTVDLSTITASDYGMQFFTGGGRLALVKTTDGDGVHWALYKAYSGYATTKITDLYYNSASSSNTYQIYVDGEGYDFRYIGNWPTFIGVANQYLNYYYPHSELGTDFYGYLTFVGLLDKPYGGTPVVRIDDAKYLSTSYPIIEDQVYDQAAFKTNPQTTISNPIKYGTSITFGGNTYVVTDGNITIGSHTVPVKDLKLSSTQVVTGYENKIGNTVISITAEPSTIVFNGKWSADISTVSMSESALTKTEWTPGQFGWDGIDQNFLMVGLLTSIGVFIALGLYVRRTKSSLWPLLVVCGGAVMLFFVML